MLPVVRLCYLAVIASFYFFRNVNYSSFNYFPVSSSPVMRNIVSDVVAIRRKSRQQHVFNQHFVTEPIHLLVVLADSFSGKWIDEHCQQSSSCCYNGWLWGLRLSHLVKAREEFRMSRLAGTSNSCIFQYISVCVAVMVVCLQLPQGWHLVSSGRNCARSFSNTEVESHLEFLHVLGLFHCDALLVENEPCLFCLCFVAHLKIARSLRPIWGRQYYGWCSWCLAICHNSF